MSLTEFELRALNSLLTSDAHANRPVSDIEGSFFQNSGQLYGETISLDEAYREFRETFCELSEQTYDEENMDCIFNVSSSANFDTLGKYLSGLRVGLIEPCFDSLSQVLRRSGVQLQPYSPEFYNEVEKFDSLNCDALCLVTPNNPTGEVISERNFIRLAEQCTQNGVLLILDTSFRLYTQKELQYDQYEILNSLGTRYVFVEDSGKSFDLKEQKISMMVGDKQTISEMKQIHHEIWFSNSVHTLQLLTGVMKGEIFYNRNLLRNYNERNRQILAKGLKNTGIIMEEQPNISVSWLRFPDEIDTELFRQKLFEEFGVALLPGDKFYWSGENTERGRQYLRIALSRAFSTIQTAAEAISEVYSKMLTK